MNRTVSTNSTRTNFSELGYLRVATATPTLTIGDVDANTAAVLSLANALADQGVALGVFPELCLSGYSAEDLFFSEALLQAVGNALSQLCQSRLPLLAVGAPWRLADGRLLNCSVFIGNGRVLGMVPKSFLPNYSEFYEQRWFVSGANINETEVNQDLGTFHVRVDQLFQLGPCWVGAEICEDLWAPVSPGTQAALAGASIVCNLSASNELISKADYRRDLVRMTSASNFCAYVYASAGALESTKDVVFGGHCLIAEAGQLLAESERFALTAQTLRADIDLQRLSHDRSQNSTFAQMPRPRAFRRVATDLNLDALCALAHGVLHYALHRATEHHPTLQLLGDVLSNQTRVDVRFAYLFNVDVNRHTHFGGQVPAQTIDVLTFLTDHNAGACSEDGDARCLRGALDLDPAHRGGIQFLQDVFTHLEIVDQILRVGFAIRIPD